MLQEYKVRRVRLFLFGLVAFVSLGHSLAQPLSDKGLVASYPFQGNAVDSSSNGNDAVVHGATPAAGHDGGAASAYALDGTDDYLMISHSDSLSLDTRATFSLWWKHEVQASPNDYYTLFEKSDPERGGHSRYGMWLIDNHVEVCLEAPDNSTQNCLDSTEPIDQGWHHLVASYDGARLQLYLDGEPSGERTIEPSGISQSSYEIFVGTDQYAPEPIYTRGVIDDLRIYNRALSAVEIAALSHPPKP